MCELESIKIRRTKIVGKKGVCEFQRNQHTQRFLVGGIDHIQKQIERITSEQEKPVMKKSPSWDEPIINFFDPLKDQIQEPF